MLSTGDKYTTETWQRTCETIQKLFELVSPYELLTWSSDDDGNLQTRIAILEWVWRVTQQFTKSAAWLIGLYNFSPFANLQ